MKYVIDSSVAFKWVLREIDSDKADRLRENYQNSILLMFFKLKSHTPSLARNANSESPSAKPRSLGMK